MSTHRPTNTNLLADEAPPPRRAGPLDDTTWPEKLTARVVAPGSTPRIHGYDVESDLARHYSWAETILLTLTGELPTPASLRAFEIAMHFLAPAPVNEAPTHATVVARVCNVFTSALVGTAAITLAEQAHQIVCMPVAEAGSPRGPSTSESVERLRAALRHAGLTIPGTEGEVGRTQALLATLSFAGLGRAELQEAAIVLARLPCAIAEAFATPAHSYRDYPVQLPDVRYVEER
jgi:hypothetical protein